MDDLPALNAWRTTAEAALVDALNEDHTFVKRFREIRWNHGRFTAVGRDIYSAIDEMNRMAVEANQLARRGALKRSRALLTAAADYVSDSA